MALRVLRVLSVNSRRQIGTIELSDDGELHVAPRGVQGLVDGMAKSYGWDPRETFRHLKGWSNGYLQIVPALSIARVFDGLTRGTDEPRFAAEHPIVADLDRRRRLSDYLKNGRPIFSTTARDVDRVDRARGQVVPLSFRTDGTCIWTDTVTYYLETYGLKPDAELASHIAAGGYRCPDVTDVTAQRALDELHLPPSDQERHNAENGIARAVTGTVLKVLDVRSGALIGTIELTDSGELRGNPPAVLEDVNRMAAARGRSPQEAFEDFNGWSNGYVQIVASEDQES